jgi:hypothetical protein
MCLLIQVPEGRVNESLDRYPVLVNASGLYLSVDAVGVDHAFAVTKGGYDGKLPLGD